MKKTMTSEHLLMLPDVLEQFLAGQKSGFGAVDVHGTPGRVGEVFGGSNVRIRAVDVRGTPGRVGAVFGGSNVRILGLFDVGPVFEGRLLRFLWITLLLPISILKCDRKSKDS